jgi:hypothetical protein
LKTVNLYSDQQLALADLIGVATDTPRDAQADITQALVASTGPVIISGFETQVQHGKLTVRPGRALLPMRMGQRVVPNQVVRDDAPAVTLDVSRYPALTYKVYVTAAAAPSDVEERSLYNAQSTGFVDDRFVATRSVTTFAALVSRTDPGPAYCCIAEVTLPAGDTTDLRELLFEGRAADKFARAWGSEADRSDDRGKAPIGDLRTMVDALKTAIEDVKGAPWYTKIAGTGGGGGGGTSPAPGPRTRIFWGADAPSDALNPSADDAYIRYDSDGVMLIYRAQ